MKKIVVTKIINKFEVLLNVGEEDGITRSSRFEIVGILDNILDPITQEPLGTLTYPKVKLKVKRLMPKMCICEDSSNRVENALISSLLASTSFEKKVIENELNLDVDDFVTEQLDKAIYLGDEVILLNNPSNNTDDSDKDENFTDN